MQTDLPQTKFLSIFGQKVIIQVFLITTQLIILTLNLQDMMRGKSDSSQRSGNREQVEVKNLIIQFVRENSIAGDDKGRLEYELVGSGKAIVFIDGKAVDATWSKASRMKELCFTTLMVRKLSLTEESFG
jgi:hypothetical protein